MSEPEEQCIICLEPLPGPSTLDGLDKPNREGAADGPIRCSSKVQGQGQGQGNDEGKGEGKGKGKGGSEHNGDADADADADAELVPANTTDTTAAAATDTTTASTTSTTNNTITINSPNDDANYLNIVAALDGCNHVIHDACIRSWAQKTNTCPICREPFHTVRVYNGLDGTAISQYAVQDKKQVAEFDIQQWVGENPEEEEEPGNPCPICNSAEREDVLLLCDSCDAAYHTHCIGLDYIPDGDWYCMECAHMFQLTQEPPEASEAVDRSPRRPQYVRRPNPRDVRGYHVRTRERLRRARRQARNVEWQGAWGQFSNRFYEMSELDLDNHDEEDEDLERYRHFQERGRRELDRWQQRMAIANRLGARDAFANNIPPAISQRLLPHPEPIPETRDERRGLGALEIARETDAPNPTTRKRKVRSVTASPREPAQEPERKLKRPRTRRLPTQNGEGSSSMSSPAAGPSSAARPTNGPSSSSRNGALVRNGNDPPLVSSLLKELEPSAMSDDESSATHNGWRHPPDASSPALSPTTSAFSSPRALSLTPPPLPSANGRPTSPTLSLSTYIQPRYGPANYSPTRSNEHRVGNDRRINNAHRINNDHGDPESPPKKMMESRPLELRQPRPRRPRQVSAPSEDQSPTRWSMTQEEKKSINDIVKGALRPHWRAQKLTTEQYAMINRDISRKLYDEVKGASSINDEARRRSWEKKASKEVAQAVAELQA